MATAEMATTIVGSTRGSAVRRRLEESKNQTTLIPASNVEGNITSCKVENQVKTIKKDSVFSIQRTTTYMTYDVCNRQQIAEYQVPEFTGLGVWAGVAVIVVIVIILAIVADA